MVGLSESLRAAVSEYGIDVSVLCPGAVDTEILRNSGTAAGPETHAFLKAGTGIDAVGEMVVAGMEARALWIHTDDSMRPYVTMRMEGLLASIP